LTEHFLHIGKTGGTAVKHALQPYAARFGIVLHEHATTLLDVPAGESFFFFLRDPVSRFVSSFNSRKRCGRPRYNEPWSEDERWAFARFATPDQLAGSLSAADPALAGAAALAMRRIGWVRSSYDRWLIGRDWLAGRLPDLRFIGLQESLAEDFETLKRLLGLPDECRLPDDPVTAHRTPAGLDRDLGAAAVANLRRWYAGDLAVYQFCRELRATMRWG
jgi:hypothetical protein